MLHSAIQRAKQAEARERREAERHNVHIRSVLIDITLQDEPVTVLNISTNGLLASCTGKFMIGASVSIEMPDLGTLNAVIRWAGNGLIGCEFRDAIDEASFFNFLERHNLEA